MDKQLFSEMPEVKRVQMLRDNCDGAEEVGYMKHFSPQQITEMKDDLSEVAIQINDVNEEKAEAMKDYKERLKPLAETKKVLLRNIKQKAEFVTEQCFKFVDITDRMVGYYNTNGELISSRPMRSDEGQLTIRMTGTDN
jgi:hypothetical protein